MRVAVCDDSAGDQALVIRTIHECIDDARIPAEIYSFRTGGEFLKAEETFDIVFMDIHLPDMTGIQAVQRCAQPGALVFVTASADYAAKAFELNASDYLLKPVPDHRIRKSLERCMNKLRIVPVQAIPIRVCSGSIPVPAMDILYIEVFNKISVIHTANNSIETFMSLSRLQQILDPHVFLRVQRSFIVNMHEIQEFRYSAVQLRSGRMISVSRDSRQKVLDQYQDFLLECAGRNLQTN